jgi:hypothetical protein
MSSIANAAGVQAGRVQAFGDATAAATVANNSNAATVASIDMNSAAQSLNVLNGAAVALEAPKKGTKGVLDASGRAMG